MMVLWRLALPMCMLVLCAAGRALRGLCDHTKCCALFLEDTDSLAAKARCADSGGKLYDLDLWGGLPALQLPDGHFWVTENPSAGCVAAAVASDHVQIENRTCTDALEGFMCQYTETCRALPSDDARVNYSTAWGFEGQTVFPLGTLAVVHVPHSVPISKHLCTGTSWMPAPWSCEVIGGGCEYGCNKPRTCSCPAGQSLHHNRFTCIEDPCAKCTHECVEQGTEFVCRCRDGFKLGPGGHCVDVDECSEDWMLCSGPGETCENEEGTYKCVCQDDYDSEDGVCLDSSICQKCEHDCVVVDGALTCTCRKGFKVHPMNPNKCVQFCSEQDCPAICPGEDQCYCPEGFIQDKRENDVVCTDIDECEWEAQCDHYCNNTFGGFFCVCEEGFELQEGGHCKLIEPLLVLGQAHPTPSSVHPTALPTYVKTGSILGITVFALICAALLYYLLHRLFIYCNTLHLYSIKHEMEIFSLQQVSTETYKRMSHDWQSRNDCIRL